MIRRVLLILFILTCLIIANTGCDIISPEPDIAQIKSDLMGETISRGGMSWSFVALSEFEHVTIVDKIRQGNTIEYDIGLKLKDIFTGEMYEANLLIIYQRSGTHWDLFSILPMSLKPSNSNNDEPKEV